MACSPEAQRAYNERLDRRLEGTVWNAGNCRSWYLDEHGRSPSIWPTYTWRFRRATSRFDPAEHLLSTSEDLRTPGTPPPAPTVARRPTAYPHVPAPAKTRRLR
ncbi:hypothetical protein [Streptomyces sp. NPDC017529]|uniref:hypothetical protein n=1 Tax=Streptomyces sp. NPDC017529 TaxID=3365000 RepID=UPI00378C80FE